MPAASFTALLPLALAAALPLAAKAQPTQQHTDSVISQLVEAPLDNSEQALATGAVTHRVQLPAEPGQATVVVRSIQPDSVAGNYRIDFNALDVDGDGFISRDEAQANPALADEFNALDSARRGKLAREQLAGWLLH